MIKALFPFLVVAIAIAALVGGGGAQASDDRTIDVTLDEWSLTPDRATVSAGRVTFRSTNEGAIEHEMLVVRSELEPDEIRDPRFAGVYVLGQPHSHFAKLQGLRSGHIVPGRSRTDEVDLKPGNYVLLCSINGHMRQGQRAALRVTG